MEARKRRYIYWRIAVGCDSTKPVVRSALMGFSAKLRAFLVRSTERTYLPLINTKYLFVYIGISASVESYESYVSSFKLRLTQHLNHRTSTGVLSVLSAGRRVVAMIVDWTVVISRRNVFGSAAHLMWTSMQMNTNEDIKNWYNRNGNNKEDEGRRLKAIDEEHFLLVDCALSGFADHNFGPGIDLIATLRQMHRVIRQIFNWCTYWIENSEL